MLNYVIDGNGYKFPQGSRTEMHAGNPRQQYVHTN